MCVGQGTEGGVRCRQDAGPRMKSLFAVESDGSAGLRGAEAPKLDSPCRKPSQSKLV